MSRAVVAFDKFRGTATASELASTVGRALSEIGWEVHQVPLADGGEGSLEVLGGANKVATVRDPLGNQTQAGWRLEGREAFIEMSAASGLGLIGGAENNDPLAADTYGTGQLVSRAVELGARRVWVFLGGSATTDGGWGAIQALPPAARLKEVDLIAAFDVGTRFTEAAEVFGPQKGASPAQVKLLTGRLSRLVQIYSDEYGVEVSELAGGGAAGGLGGGLAAVGARLESGFDLLAERVEFDSLIEGASLVITGEGLLDDQSFKGKVVGGVGKWANAAGVPVLAVVGARDHETEIPAGIEVVSLTEAYGQETAMSEVLEKTREVVLERALRLT